MDPPRQKRSLENLGLELKSEPETNVTDAAILRRRIGKPVHYAASPRTCSARSCSGEGYESLGRH
jgi:hypothetical protein